MENYIVYVLAELLASLISCDIKLYQNQVPISELACAETRCQVGLFCCLVLLSNIYHLKKKRTMAAFMEQPSHVDVQFLVKAMVWQEVPYRNRNI